MELRIDVDGWICLRKTEAMLHKIRVMGANGKREARILSRG